MKEVFFILGILQIKNQINSLLINTHFFRRGRRCSQEGRAKHPAPWSHDWILSKEHSVCVCVVGWKINLQWRKPNKHRQRPAPTPKVIVLIECTFDMKLWKWHFTSVTYHPTICNPNPITRKTSDKPKLKDILQSTWQVLFKTVKIIRNRESLRNCHSPEEAQENDN